MRLIRNVIYVVAVLLIGANALAGWWRGVADPNAGDLAKWSVPTNWSTGLVPVAGEKTQFRDNYPEAVIDYPGAVSGQTVVGDGGSDTQNRLRIADGGVWNAGPGDWTAAGYNRSGHITVDRGGSMITAHRVGVGLVVSSSAAAIDSTLNVNGGLVDITGNLQIGSLPSGSYGGHKGIVNVNSGILEATNWEWRDSTGLWSFMNIRHGTVVIGTDVTAAIPGLITAHALTGFGGQTTPTAVFANGVTTITAPDPLNRSPKMDAFVAVDDVPLSWTNVGTAPVWVAVYFGTDPANLTRVIDPNTHQNLTSTSVNVQSPGEYIWRVDTYDSFPGTDPNDPIVGETMYFSASDDFPPSVAMITTRTVTWMNEPTTLQATVTDDGKSAVTVTWSAADTSGADAGPMVDPNVVFNPAVTVLPAGTTYPYVVSTTMTVDYHAAQMTAKVTVQDSNPFLETGSASVALDCATDACQASTAVLHLNNAHKGDVALDCKLNLEDFAVFARNWLNDYKLTAPVPAP